MGVQRIDKQTWIKMVEYGAKLLDQDKEKINRLNVFPVPDGDTGTNMNLSMASGISEMVKLKKGSLFDSMNAFIKGLLMGARGNSGVILSQLFSGFSTKDETEQIMNCTQFAHALDRGVKIAYETVTNPVEGTILTVAKDMAAVARKEADKAKEFISFLEAIVTEGKQSLMRTPDLLPILKEAGVVDSGGKGLLTIYKGFLAALKGEPLVDYTDDQGEKAEEIIHEISEFRSIDEIKYGYCTELVVEFNQEKLHDIPFNEVQFKQKLLNYGDSLLVASHDDFVKIHIHTEQPGKVMSIAQEYGELVDIDIDNMRKQFEQFMEIDSKMNKKEQQEIAIIAVAQGKGLKKILTSLGVTVVIDGGQTMNPSTEDFLQEINNQNALHTYILPNNKNILLAAKQAAQLSEHKVTVLPSQTIPQGIRAFFEFDREGEQTANIDNMIQGMKDVKTGLVTYATRDTTVNDVTIKKNEYIGLDDETIKISHANKNVTLKQLLQTMIDDLDEIVTIFVGQDITPAEIEQLYKELEQQFAFIEFEIHEGDQPIYSYIIMIE